MINPDLRRKVTTLAMFILPLVVVRVSAWYFSLTPEAVAQNIYEAEPAPIELGWKRVKPTREEKAARVYMKQLADEPFAETPMFYLTRRVATTDPTPPPEDTLGQLVVTVTLIIESSKGATALINAMPYRVGDTLSGTRWVISDIDGATRTVEFTHPESGEVRTARVPAPRVPVSDLAGAD